MSLVAALVFNGVQLHDSATAARQTKLATELGLLTELQTVMSQATYSRVPYERQFAELRTGRRVTLSPSAYRATAVEGANMDYFAWLFNKGFIDAPGAEELWGPRMVCEYKRAFAAAFAEAPLDLTNLFEFVRRRGPALAHLASCPG